MRGRLESSRLLGKALAMQRKRGPILMLLGCVAGFVFAAFSTYDFVAHLDRQVHGVHCSFIPGIGDTDSTGASGCHETMMSPYSSVFRGSLWGGIPVSLPGMSTFAFVAFACLVLWTGRHRMGVQSSKFLLALASLLVLTSVVMGYLAFAELGAACKLCIGIYVASAVVFVGAMLAFRDARAERAAMEGGYDGTVGQRRRQASAASFGEPTPDELEHVAVRAGGAARTGDDVREELSTGGMALLLGIGALFVLVPMVAYAVVVPSYDEYVGACGVLEADKNGEAVGAGDALLVMPAVEHAPAPSPGGSVHRVIEVLDPLCSACRAFEHRFNAASFDVPVSRSVLLFPLDAECNWMISDSVHPGACAVSEAVMCAAEAGGPAQAASVITWAFSVQEELLAAAGQDPKRVRGMLAAQFPALERCVGSAKSRARLNRALRFAVHHQLPIVTPQLYVNNKKLCDEDTDLGMEYMVGKLLEVPAKPMEGERQ